MERRTFVGLGVAAGALAHSVTPAQARPDDAAPDSASASASGLTLVGDPVHLTPRLVELTFASTVLDDPTRVRVLLPEDYHSAKGRRYPVVHLFHGGLGDQATWTDPAQGNAEEFTAGLPVIAVMPEGGAAGYYTDWFNNGAFGHPAWEAYHMGQLVPWIDARYRTVPQRSARAAAGFSMGGHGALAYAARHPDLIGIAASFSGAVDISNAGLGIHNPAQLALAQQIFGDYLTQEVRWRGNNARDLAANLAHTDVSLYVGDTGSPETTINQCTRSVHDRLDELRVPHRFTVNPGLGHDARNMRRSFVDWLPHLMDAFSTRTPAPRAFTVSSIRPEYGYGDWSVRLHRDVVEFSALEVTGTREFAVVGNGSATVVTPRIARPRTRHLVRIEGPIRSRTHVVADADGRLTIPVRLGPGNPYQQFSPEADAAGTGPGPDTVPFHVRGNGSRFHRATVSLAPSR